MASQIRRWLKAAKGLPPPHLFFGTAGRAGPIAQTGGSMSLVTLSCPIVIQVCVRNASSLPIANVHR